MSNYTKTTDFEAKDSLPTGDSGKIIRGAEFETEFDAIATAIATKADTAGPTFTGTLTFETISDGTISIAAFVDEDDMVSDSATLVPTQQSVKAYVDAVTTELQAQDLDFQADSGGALSIDLDTETMTFTGGTGIDTSGSLNTVTFAIDSTVTTLTGTQTLTNKTLTAPVISTISNTGTLTLPTSTDTLVGRATTDTLTNKTLTSAVLNTGVSGTAVLDEDDMVSNSATQLATQQSIKAYVDSQVAGADTLAEVLGNGNTTGGTNIAFGDNDKAIFGAGSDLSIYHDGSNSYIDDSGTGLLRLRSSQIYLEKYTGEIMAALTADAGVNLRYDNAIKLETTSTGIDVTGTVTADGLTVDGDAQVSSAVPVLKFMQSDGTDQNAQLRLNANSFYINQLDDDGSTNRPVALFNVGTGDISFYEDTGTTAKFFWDASGEVLGIGTTSPSASYGLDSAKNIRVTAAAPQVELVETDASNQKWAMFGLGGDLTFRDITNNVYPMTLKASTGNVGIGTSSPSSALHVSDAVTHAASTEVALVQNTTTGQPVALAFQAVADNGGTGNEGAIYFDAGADGTVTNNQLQFTADHQSDTTPDMVITGAGNVGIGTSSPQTLVDLKDTTPTLRLTDDRDITWSGNETLGNIEFFSSDTSVSGTHVTGFIKNINDRTGGSAQVAGALTFGVADYDTAASEALRIDSSGNVGIGTSSPTARTDIRGANSATHGRGQLFISNTETAAINQGGQISLGGTYSGTNETFFASIAGRKENSLTDFAGYLQFATRAAGGNNVEHMRIDSSGNLLVGKSGTNIGAVGIEAKADGQLWATRDGNPVLSINRETSDGAIAVFYKDASAVGSIGSYSGTRVRIGSASASGIVFGGTQVLPATDGNLADNTYELGASSYRWTNIYATNGTIQTSDRNEKQDIEELSDAEQRVAVACKGLLRKFRWKSSVADKGNDARIHFGIIAQDLKAAFEAEGLDAGRYGMFINSTWTDEETGEERSRMGVRYDQLLAFIIAAI